jgi:hypothetical protein
MLTSLIGITAEESLVSVQSPQKNSFECVAVIFSFVVHHLRDLFALNANLSILRTVGPASYGFIDNLVFQLSLFLFICLINQQLVSPYWRQSMDRYNSVTT